MTSTLWLTSERRQALHSALHSVPKPAWLALVLRDPETPTAIHDPAYSAQDGAVALALHAWLQNDPALASRALTDWRTGLSNLPAIQDLGKAHLALSSAVLFDLNHHLWAPAEAEDWRTSSLSLTAAFFHLSSGNPHAIGNNWWAVTHSGLYCLAAALHASGCADTLPLAARTIPEIEEWAWSRLDAFLSHFGDGGAYHEGLGYQDYTCAYLLPAALLREHRNGENLADRFPGLTYMATLLFASGLEGHSYDDTTGALCGWGRQLSWNDAGLGWPVTAVPLLALRWAPPDQLASLLALWNRLSGHHSPGPAPHRFGSLFFQLAFYPATLPGAPASPPALSHLDRKQGLWLSRDAYAGPADAVLGAYARCHHPGGHAQNDAGSVRFSALGWDWILGGGQARPEATWQSVVVSSCPPTKNGTGAILHATDRVFGMELRAVHGAYGERYVALHPATGEGAPLAVAMLDLIDDHRTDRDWFWRLTTSPQHTFTPAIDGLGFTLVAPDGATLEARFLGAPPAAVFLESTPGSSRTFANGTTKNYLPRPCVVASFARSARLAIYVVLTARPPAITAPAPVLIPDAGLSVAWDDATWDRPFGLVFPACIALSRLRGQSPHPAPLSS